MASIAIYNMQDSFSSATFDISHAICNMQQEQEEEEEEEQQQVLRSH